MLVFTANHHRQSFSAFAIRQNKVPLTLQECHELLTMIHFITGNNHELLTMIHLIKHIIFIESAIGMQFPASYSNIFTVNRTVMHDGVDW